MKHENRFRLAVRLIRLICPLQKWIVFAALCGLLGGLCAAMIPVFGTYALLDVLENATSENLLTFAGILLVVAILCGLFRYGESVMSSRIAYSGMALLRDRIFNALRKSAPAQFSDREKGKLVSILMADVEHLETFYEHTLIRAIWTGLYVIILSVFMGFFHPVLGVLAFVGYSVVGFLIPFVTVVCSRRTGEALRRQSGELSGYLLDSLHGVSETLQYGGGEQREQTMDRQTDCILKEEKKLRFYEGSSRGITDACIIFFEISMVIVSAILYQHGLVSFAGVLVPSICLIESFEPCLELAHIGHHLSKTFASGIRVLSILEEKEITPEVAHQPTVSFGDVKIDRATVLSDGYPVLQNASMEIQKNTIVGLTGPSSSGKSTLLKLLMCFDKPDTGGVYIANTPIDCINTEDLRNMESLVTQDTYLFSDSILNNLRIAKMDASLEEIQEACKKASVHEFIMSLPHGYETQVKELGDSLSGGERQRIGLARAFLHGAPFLLLDEPTSNLDSLNEAVILRSLHNQRKDKTVLLVSHRHSALCIADRVYAAERGRITERK